MILTNDEILKEIEKGNIQIDPFDKECVGPGSIDLHLDNKFRVFKENNGVYEVNEESNYEDVTKLIEKREITLRPKETILGITKEKIKLSSGICGWLEGRSRFARLGLMVHISSSFVQPGIENKQVLEISNMSNIPLKLQAGTKICQFIFEKTKGKAKYKGKFKNQIKP